MVESFFYMISDNKVEFCDLLQKVKNVVVFIGVGVSVESGIFIFCGFGGFWRIFRV